MNAIASRKGAFQRKAKDLWVWRHDQPEKAQPVTLLVIDDKIPAYFADADLFGPDGVQDKDALFLLAHCALEKPTLKAVLFASFDVTQATLSENGVSHHEHVVALIDVYDGIGEDMKAENARGKTASRTVVACGVPLSNIYAWTKQNHYNFTALGLIGFFSKHRRKDDLTRSAPETVIEDLTLWLNRIVTDVRPLCAEAVWAETEAMWFNGNPNHPIVPHDFSSELSREPLRVYLQRLLKQNPPESWFSDSDYPHLYYSVRSLVGKCACAHAGEKGESISFGGFVLVFLAGLRETASKEWIGRWCWEALASVALAPPLEKNSPRLSDLPAQSEAERRIKHQARALAVAAFANALGDRGGNSAPGFREIITTKCELQIHLNFDPTKARAGRIPLVNTTINSEGVGRTGTAYQRLLASFSEEDRKKQGFRVDHATGKYYWFVMP